MIRLNAAILFKWTQSLSHRDGVNLFSCFWVYGWNWGRRRERERGGISFCSGQRVDKQHPGNWSVNIAGDWHDTPACGKLYILLSVCKTAFYRSIYCFSGVCGRYMGRGWCTWRLFWSVLAKYPPNFHRSEGALKKIEQICDEEPLWRNLRVFED